MDGFKITKIYQYYLPTDLPTKAITDRNKQKHFKNLCSCPTLEIVVLP